MHTLSLTRFSFRSTCAHADPGHDRERVPQQHADRRPAHPVRLLPPSAVKLIFALGYLCLQPGISLPAILNFLKVVFSK